MGKRISEAERLGNEIRNSFNQWKGIYENGESDPFWPDGANLELVRNHIIYYKKQCEELLEPGDYPDEYFQQLPPEVPRNYMAHPDEIREAARKSLETYKTDSDYLFILQAVNKLTKQQNEQTHASSILRYVSGLEDSIRCDRLIEMRRHRKPDLYLAGFQECRKKIENILGDTDRGHNLPLGQLSLFDLFGLT